VAEFSTSTGLPTRFSDSALPTSQGGESLSADEKITLILAMIDGLRVQSLLDPSRDVPGPLEAFMKLVITPQEGG
jgi:hypothetical protein